MDSRAQRGGGGRQQDNIRPNLPLASGLWESVWATRVKPKPESLYFHEIQQRHLSYIWESNLETGPKGIEDLFPFPQTNFPLSLWSIEFLFPAGPLNIRFNTGWTLKRGVLNASPPVLLLMSITPALPPGDLFHGRKKKKNQTHI